MGTRYWIAQQKSFPEQPQIANGLGIVAYQAFSEDRAYGATARNVPQKRLYTSANVFHTLHYMPDDHSFLKGRGHKVWG